MQIRLRWWWVGALALLSALPAFAEKPKIYLVGDFGWAKTYYGNNGAVQNFVSTQQPNLSSHVPLALDLAAIRGFGAHFALGLGFDAVLDYYYQNSTGSLGQTNVGDVTDIGYVVTTRYSFGSSVLSGVFLRADFGLGVLNTNGNIYSVSSNSPSSTGFFALGGAGINIQLSPHVAIHPEADYSRNFVSSGSIGAFEPVAGLVVLL